LRNITDCTNINTINILAFVESYFPNISILFLCSYNRHTSNRVELIKIHFHFTRRSIDGNGFSHFEECSV